MNQNLRAVDRIERAGERRPFCPCGRHTTAVWRDGAVWLECASIGDRPTGIVRRITAGAFGPRHVRERIVEVAAA